MDNSGRFTFWLGVITLLVILALGMTLVFAVWKLLELFSAFLTTVDPQIAAQMIGMCGTIIAAVFAVVVGQVYAKDREIREAHRKARTQIYLSFVQKMTEFVLTHKDRAEEDVQSEWIAFFKDFNTKLVLYGSDSVIKAFNSWRRSDHSESNSAILAMDRFLREIRRDLGHRNRGLKSGDVINVYLKQDE